MTYVLIDSPLTPYSTPDEINSWLDELSAMPVSEEVNMAIEKAKSLLNDVLSREKQ